MDLDRRYWIDQDGITAYPETPKLWCSKEGKPLDLDLSFHPVKQTILSGPSDFRRYIPFVGLENPENFISLGEPITPLIPVQVDDKELLVKQDFLFPTGSYKDRGAAVMMNRAKEMGVKKVIQDSSGNAGCSVAAYAAAMGIACDIFVPASTSPAKLIQIEMYGARLIKIKGSREDTAAAAREAADRGEYYASHCFNPYFYQGTKTFAYELCDQLGWNAPDKVVLPLGNGTLVMGCWIGFSELKEAGVIQKIPQIIGVQASSCAPLFSKWKTRKGDVFQEPVFQATLAEGIAIGDPVRGEQLISVIDRTNGSILAVSEQEISDAFHFFRHRGFYPEITSCAALAGALRVLRESGPDESVCTLITGSGLKSTDKYLSFLKQ